MEAKIRTVPNHLRTIQKSDERQASTLFYCLGSDAEDTLSTIDISEENGKKYQNVLEKFDTFFAVR